MQSAQVVTLKSEQQNASVLRDRLLEQFGLMVRECSNKLGSSERYLRLAVQTKKLLISWSKS
jgi:histidinol-phosphate/aromatic aminotransferase/cobyric acid decarboxylase-like protein